MEKKKDRPFGLKITEKDQERWDRDQTLRGINLIRLYNAELLGKSNVGILRRKTNFKIKKISLNL